MATKLPVFTGDIRRRFMEYIRNGYSAKHAAAACGLDYPYVKKILVQGRRAMESNYQVGDISELDEVDLPSYEFFREYLKNRAEGAGVFIEAMRERALEFGSETAIKWFLEFVYGSDFDYLPPNDGRYLNRIGNSEGSQVTNIVIMAPDEDIRGALVDGVKKMLESPDEDDD